MVLANVIGLTGGESRARSWRTTVRVRLGLIPIRLRRATILFLGTQAQNGTSIFNDGNHLTEDANFTYQYDANGNLVHKTDKSTLLSTVYEYDAENKLVRVSSLDKTVNYKYDGLERRIEKEVTETGVTTTTQYIYDNEDIIRGQIR